jgi:hypothetical protein
MAERRLVGFVERLIGKAIANLGNTELGKVVTRFHETLDTVKKFETTLYDKIKAALDQSFQFQLHAEYSRATEQTALLDFEIDLRTDAGKRLMKAAGHGNFAEVLNSYDGGAVKLHEGVLTHKVTKQSKFNVNIVGWHLGWNYQGLDRVITQSEQRINADAGGQLTIITTFDLQRNASASDKANASTRISCFASSANRRAKYSSIREIKPILSMSLREWGAL